jgi:hypothetical protein
MNLILQTKRFVQAFYLLAICLLLACGGAGHVNTVSVYKYKDALRCVPGSGKSLLQLEQELTNAGIQVLSSENGSDLGVIPENSCNTLDDSYGIFEIPEIQLETALSLGFNPWPGPV